MTRPNISATLGYRQSAFLVVGTVLVLSVAAIYLMGSARLASARALSHQQMVLAHLNGTLSTVKDAETGQRGYLLTGEDRYLEPYHSALARIHDELAALDGLAGSEDLTRQEVERFKSLTAAKLQELEVTIALRRTQSLDAALAEVRTDRGQRDMESLRALTTALVNRETHEFDERQEESRHLTIWRTIIFVAALLINLFFLAWAYRRIQLEAIGRENVAHEVLEQKELLAITLASIGDGVIVTDTQGRITFLNEVAAKLSGWRKEDALDLPCSDVFHIVNESTRQIVESPVQKVLQNGLVVGLANHTLLIRKDGTELPIDDSGAPVRDRKGELRGVVLVFRDFSAHKKAEQDLIRAKTDAEEANIAKDNFLATLSHELRTPLTPVLATLASWELDAAIAPVLLPDIQMMRRNVELEARLIDDLLDLTRIVRGKLSLNPEVADVHELLRSVADMFTSEIHTKKLTLSLDLTANRHYVLTDPARLQQVFWNILKNATKFTREGGRIDLMTANDNGRVRITFNDDGIGIGQELLAKLFLPFEQGTHESVRRYGGLGLGLAICKALMDMQGGTIAAESDGAGSGSRFTVDLPCVDAPNRKDYAVSQVPVPQQVLNILLVEDHVDTARVMSRLLRAGGHQVHVADCVAAAVTAAGANNIDLIISDIGLPDGTGIDLMTQIRQGSQVPAIALTGFGMDDDVNKCLAAGFNDHLTKPVNLQKLEMIIRKLTS